MRSQIFKWNWKKFFLMAITIFSAELAIAGITGVTASSDATNSIYQFRYTNKPTYFRIYLDTDMDGTSGYSIGGRGADYMIENTSFYRYSGTNGSWAWYYVKSVPMSKTSSSVKWTVARTDLKSPSSLYYLAQTTKPSETSRVYSQTLSTLPSANCLFNGQTIASGSSVTTYQSSSVPYGSTCSSEIRTCNNGTLSGSYQYSSCSVAAPASCTFNGQTIASGGSVTTYQSSSVPYGSACSSETRTCSNGTLSGSYQYSSCSIAAPAPTSCTFNGQTVASGSSVTAFQSSSVPYGSSCSSEARTCNDGTLSGSYQYSACSVAPATASPTFYISLSGNDANAGTQSSPWRTVRKAASVVNPGDTVILMDGTYEEPEVAFKRSGTASQPITIMAQNKWQAIISSTSGCQPAFSMYASYITVKDLHFSVSPRNINCGTYTSSNVHIRAWNSVNATPLNPTTGLVGFRASGLKIDNLYRSEGIKSNQDFTVIENSEVAHSLEIMGSLNSVIRNNIVTGTGQYGVSIFAKGGVRNAQIYNNIVRNRFPNGQAIIIGGYSCDTCHFDTSTNIEAYNTVAYNNIVINESSSGTMAGLMFQGAKDSAFFNNVVINGVISSTIGGHNTGPQAPTSNPVFKNNIVLCYGKSLTSGYHGWSSTGTVAIDYNNFYNCSSAPAQAHTISGDPKFVNTTSDFHLQLGSSGINSGTPVSFPAYGGGYLDISRDKDGVVRSSPWDLGVYNVTP